MDLREVVRLNQLNTRRELAADRRRYVEKTWAMALQGRRRLPRSWLRLLYDQFTDDVQRRAAPRG